MPTVFLSYAHDDNRVPDGLKGSGWVSFFDNSLRIELDERGMIDVKIWRDKRDFNTMDLVVNTLDAGVTSPTSSCRWSRRSTSRSNTPCSSSTAS